MKSTVLMLTASAVLFFATSLASGLDRQSDGCNILTSCMSCLSKSYCTWCVNKSKCTKQSCGNDNIIYPKHIKALMSGPGFCPRIVKPEKESTYVSGKRQILSVKLTQIHLYMAFTVWKCKITLNGEETVVNALLVADEVYCDPVVLSNKSDKPVVEGSVSVLWDNSKSFDGNMIFKVSMSNSN